MSPARAKERAASRPKAAGLRGFGLSEHSTAIACSEPAYLLVGPADDHRPPERRRGPSPGEAAGWCSLGAAPGSLLVHIACSSCASSLQPGRPAAPPPDEEDCWLMATRSVA